MTKRKDPHAADRYARLRVLPSVGKKGIAILRRSHVTVVGLGALGSSIAELLARSGVASLTVVDRDIVELSNLSSQSLYDKNDVGLPKASQAAAHLQRMNPDIHINPLPLDVTPSSIDQIGTHLIIDATDNIPSRLLLNDYAKKNRIPLLHCSVLQDRGFVFFSAPEKNAPCVRCWLPNPSALPTCETAGLWPSASHLVSAIAVDSALKFLLKKSFPRRLLHVSLKKLEIIPIRVERNPSCTSCGGKYEALVQRQMHRSCSSTHHFQLEKTHYAKLKKRLSAIDEVREANGCLLFRELILFNDGRVLVKADSQERARSILSRYLG